MKKILYALLLLSPYYSYGSDENGLVKWITLKEAFQKNEIQSKPFLIDFYTDWCGWCKHMMKTTYSDPALAEYINTNFYAIKFNGEGKDTVEFLNEKLIPTAPGPRVPHPFVMKFLPNTITYPTTIFLNGLDKEKNEFKLSMVASGYLDIPKIQPMLIFTLENVFRNSTFDDFKLQYEKAFSDTAYLKNEKNWTEVNTGFLQTTTAKKKSLVYINTKWCNSCQVMKRSSFRDTLVSEYLNSKFTLVNFNPEIKDTLSFKDQAFAPDASNPFHPLAFVLTRKNFLLPSLVILDEKMEIIDVVQGYFGPVLLNDILRFYGDDIYRKKSWQEYKSTSRKKKSGIAPDFS